MSIHISIPIYIHLANRVRQLEQAFALVPSTFDPTCQVPLVTKIRDFRPCDVLDQSAIVALSDDQSRV